MFNVPSHLLQPLFVDTNISYDLDMSKFPGLDDPHQMYEPALLISTDWSQYVMSDEDEYTMQNILTSEEDDTNVTKDFDQTIFTDVITTNVFDPTTFQSLIDDVIDDPELCDMLDNITSDTSDISLEDIETLAEYITDTFILKEVIVDDSIHADNLIQESKDDVFGVTDKGQKRKRTYDTENNNQQKKFKKEYKSSAVLSTYNLWQSKPDKCVFSCRES